MQRRPATRAEARALANPLRLRILRLCLDRSMTNEELAARLGRDAGSVLHHVRVLVETGFLAAEEERRGARGSVERPYRSTGKSWTLDVSDEEKSAARTGPGIAAVIDAFKAEVGEVPQEGVVELSRLAARLQPEARDAFAERLHALVEEIVAADDPDGEPYGFLFGMHRRAE
ncbi:MAG TPA: helix-turn-helix domain-containing protein [Candidatus Limnocylindrales bacterium]|nr:helix-turn-helix domain-containing protein [Candidatus Limnocylindrales bacterium]